MTIKLRPSRYYLEDNRLWPCGSTSYIFGTSFAPMVQKGVNASSLCYVHFMSGCYTIADPTSSFHVRFLSIVTLRYFVPSSNIDIIYRTRIFIITVVKDFARMTLIWDHGSFLYRVERPQCTNTNIYSDFYGIPTVVFDGEDLMSHIDAERVSLQCRWYASGSLALDIIFKVIHLVVSMLYKDIACNLIRMMVSLWI